MFRTSSPRSGLTRRSFLKAAGAAAGALGLAGAAGMTTADSWLAPAQAHAEPEGRVGYTFHYRHCQCNCHLKCTVRDGRMVLVGRTGRPRQTQRDHLPEGYFREIQHTYSKERLQVPLKRVGERGSGEDLVEITWDEALDTIAEKVKETQEEIPDREPSPSKRPSTRSPPSFPSCSRGRRSPTAESISGWATVSLRRSPNRAGRALLVERGDRLEERQDHPERGMQHAGDVHGNRALLLRGRRRRREPRSSRSIPTSARPPRRARNGFPWSPEPIRPLYLGMISIILDNGWYNAPYLKANTSMPFLVKRSDGSLLRKNPVDDIKQSGADNPFMVWDEASGSLSAYNAEGVNPALEYEATIDGEAYATVFSLLKEGQKQYTPSWAAETTGIGEDVLVEITDKYANHGPSILSFGFGGGEKFYNADVAGHAAVLLATLVGSFGTDIPGWGSGCVRERVPEDIRCGQAGLMAAAGGVQDRVGAEGERRLPR